MKKMLKTMLCLTLALATAAAPLSASAEVEIVNSYDNTAELIEKFPVIYPTPVDEGISERIQNRLLTGFENWNRGFDAWKAWGEILYTDESIYNVHGARLSLAEYQAAMNVSLQQVDIQMGDFYNMIICDNWAAIRYQFTTIAGDYVIPGSVKEFVNFADYDGLGTRVVEGWGSTKDASYAGMAAFQGEENRQIEQEQAEALIAYEIPKTEDLAEKYPVLYPTTDNSDMADEIRAALLKEFDAWNRGYDAWAENADGFYRADALCAEADDVQHTLEEYKDIIREQFEERSLVKKYFDSMLISGDWAATHYRYAVTDNETGEQDVGDYMQFFRFVQTDDGVKAVESWLS